MTREEEIKQAANIAYSQIAELAKEGKLDGSFAKIFILGAKWADEHPKNLRAQQQELFDVLNPYEKADFMKNNIAWARTRDLFDELKLRNEL